MKKVQEALIFLGYDIPLNEADGSFGQSTKEALLEFQSYYKLNQTGLLDGVTISTLKDLINEIKQQLIQKGFNLGDKGSNFIQAIKDFQKSKKLPITGKADKVTLSYLELFTKRKSDFFSIIGNIYNSFIDLIVGKTKLLSICNNILKSFPIFPKINVEIKILDKSYILYSDNDITITAVVKLGIQSETDEPSYIFKNSICVDVGTGNCTFSFSNIIDDTIKGLMLHFEELKDKNLSDILEEAIIKEITKQNNNDIKVFNIKEKIGESIINGSLDITFKENLIEYEFKIAKNDDLKTYYGTFKIIIKLNGNMGQLMQNEITYYKKRKGENYSINNISIEVIGLTILEIFSMIPLIDLDKTKLFIKYFKIKNEVQIKNIVENIFSDLIPNSKVKFNIININNNNS